MEMINDRLTVDLGSRKQTGAVTSTRDANVNGEDVGTVSCSPAEVGPAQGRRYREVYICVGCPCRGGQLTAVQFLVLLEVLLEVEGLAAAGLRAGEGLLVDVLVLLVVLPFWGEKGVRREEVGAEELHLEEAQGHLPATTSHPVSLPESTWWDFK